MATPYSQKVAALILGLHPKMAREISADINAFAMAQPDTTRQLGVRRCRLLAMICVGPIGGHY